jgi:AcrR family transcriptional regulator
MNKISKGARTRQRILECAAELIAKKGLQAVTTRSLGKAARVSPGLISHHIPNMENLLFDVIQHIFAITDHPKSKSIPPDPMSELRALVRRNFGFFENHTSYYHCLLLSYVHARFDRRFSTIHTEQFAAVRNSIVLHLRELANKRNRAISQLEIEMAAQSIMEVIEGGLLFASLLGTDAIAQSIRQVELLESLVERLIPLNQLR